MSKRAIELLKEAVLYHDYRDGSFVDKSGNGNDGTPTGCYFTNNGVKCSASGDNVAVSDSASIQLTEGCLFILADFTNLISTLEKRLISKRDGGGTNYDLRAVDTGLTLYDGTNSRFWAVTTNGSKCLAVNFKDGEIAEGFKDGVFDGTFAVASSISVNDAELQIGNGTINPNSFLDSNIKAAVIFNRKLTATEHAELYGYLSSLKFSKSPYRVINANLKVANDSALVAGYNMRPQGDKIIDVSNNGNDGILTDVNYSKTPLGDALCFNGSTSNVNFGNDISVQLSDAMTFECWFKASSWTSHDMIASKTNLTGLNTGWGLEYFGGDLRFYITVWNVNFAFITAPALGVWHHVVCTYDKDASSDQIKLYLNGELVDTETHTLPINSPELHNYQLGEGFSSNFFKGEIIKPMLSDYAKDADYVTAEYNKGKQALFTCENVRESVDAQTEQIENTPFTVQLGSFKVDKDKNIKSVNSTNAAMPTSYFKQTPKEAAYGTWEFQWRREAGGASTINAFISMYPAYYTTGNNGYVLYMQSTDTLILGKVVNGSVASVINSSAGVPFGVDYKIKITRDYAGNFKVYLDGGTFDGYTEVLAGTDNSYTESKYFNIRYQTNDTIKYNSIVKRITT